MENVLDLKMPGVMELGREELKEFDGGWVWIIPAVMLGVYLYDNREKIVEGFNETFEAH